MSGAAYAWLIVAAVPLLVVGLVVAVLVVALRRARTGLRWSQIQDPVARRWRTVTATCWWVGVAVAVVGVVAIAAVEDLGRGLMLGPVVLGLVLTAATAAGEVITARTPGAAGDGDREVLLEVRTVRGLVPPGRLVLATAGVIAALLTTLAASLVSRADDLGRAGRTIPYDGIDGSFGWRGPWPGWFYTVPVWVLLVILLVAVAAVLRLVVDRRRSGPSERERFLDDLIRRTSAQRLVALVALVGFGTAALTALCGLVGLAGASDSELLPGTGISLYAVGWVCLAIALVTMVAALVSLVQLLAPSLPDAAVPAPAKDQKTPAP